jgi:hypothetical protein
MKPALRREPGDAASLVAGAGSWFYSNFWQRLKD